jgi:hypothetical protein
MFGDFIKVANSPETMFDNDTDKQYWIEEILKLKADLITASKSNNKQRLIISKTIDTYNQRIREANK